MWNASSVGLGVWTLCPGWWLCFWLLWNIFIWVHSGKARGLLASSHSGLCFLYQLSHEGLFGLHIPFGLSHHELFLTWPKINLSLFLLLIGVLSQLGKELGNYMEPSYRKGWAAVISASILTHLRIGREAALFSLCNISAWLAEVSSSMAMSKVVSCFTLLLTFFTMNVPGNLRGRY